MPNFKAITKLDKIKKALRESPMREYEMPVTQEWQDGYGSIQTIYPTVKAINPEEAAIKMQQKYDKKNWDYDVAGIGNKKYDTEYISPSKAVEFQGPGKPVTEAEYQRLLQKGKAPELYQLDDYKKSLDEAWKNGDIWWMKK